jgi:hypothetical protein
MSGDFDRMSDSIEEERGRSKGLRHPSVTALIGLALVSPVFICLGRAMIPIVTSENFGKPMGQSIPSRPPDEANRVVHPAGFSLIFPPNWEVRVEGEDKRAGRVSGVPRNLDLRSRTPAWICSTKYGTTTRPFPDQGFRSISFQGKPAFERRETKRGDKPHFRCTLFFQRGGEWYVLVYLVTQDRDSLPPMIQAYFDTFQAAQVQ